MAKRKSGNAARIQRAVTGLQIPMMQITALYNVAEQRIAQGATDQELAEACRAFIAGNTQ
jgi:hypothetical protein